MVYVLRFLLIILYTVVLGIPVLVAALLDRSGETSSGYDSELRERDRAA